MARKVDRQIVKALIQDCINKASSRVTVKLSDNTKVFFIELAEQIKEDTSFSLKPGTLYRVYYYKILKSSENGEVNLQIRTLDAFSQYAHGEDFDEYMSHKIGKVDKNNNSDLARHLYRSMKNSLIQKLPSNKHENNTPKSFYSKRYSIAPESVNQFCSLIPEMAFSNFKSKLFDDRYLERTFKRKGEVIDLNAYKSTVLCHALSPFSDSLALLLDLGRFLRLSKGFDLTPNLLLGGIEFGKINWVVKDLEKQGNLLDSFEFREKLYERLGFDDHSIARCEPDAVHKSINNELKIGDLDKAAKSFWEICQAIFDNQYLGRKLAKEDVKALKERLNEIENQQASLNGELRLLSIDSVLKNIKNQFIIIENVMIHLRRLDQDTFKYFLVQRYNQQEYDDCLKIAITREHDFDDSFAAIDRLESDRPQRLHGIYFKDYYFNDAKETVHPYYFPSGNIYTNYPVPAEAAEHVILLSDDEQKIDKLIHSIDNAMLARICADLLSFCMFYFVKDRESIDAITKKLGSISAEFAQSWKVYNAHPDAFKINFSQFSSLIFSSVLEISQVPYYFMPYIMVDRNSGLKDLKSFTSWLAVYTIQKIRETATNSMYHGVSVESTVH